MHLYLIRQDAAPDSVSPQIGLSFMVLQQLQTIQRGNWVSHPDFLGSGHDRFLETTTFINDSSKHILSKDMISVSIVDANYPVYDVYPLFMADVEVVNDSYIYHDTNEAYSNACSGIIIKRCPYEDYTSHAHSNITMLDCLNNHYYHFSHDGLCVFCRLENKTTCSHNGLETFIVPSNKFNESTSSICHVYFNRTSDGHYNGSLYEFNNNSFIYLDNAHGDKYGY